MQFNEMRNNFDKMGAFLNFISVREAKEVGIIPDFAAEYFPERCQCGSEMILDKFSRARLQCCNPFCSVKQAYMLSEMFRRFGIKGLGSGKAARILGFFAAQLTSASYVEILTIEPEHYPVSIRGSELEMLLLVGRNLMLSRQMTFAEMVSKLGLPELGLSVSNKIFGGYGSFMEFIEASKQAGSLRKLFFAKGVGDQTKLFWVANRLKDIGLANLFFQNVIRQQGLCKLPICITGSVILNGSKMTKQAFISLLNESGRTRAGIPLFEVEMNSAMNTNPFIVYSEPSCTTKYMAGVKREQEADKLRVRGFEVPKILVTPSELLEYIRNAVKEWEETNTDLVEPTMPKSEVLDVF